ncbi:MULTISPECIES: ATP-binding protein [unclassified Vibrio]|uniref:ATP-binding protein n=1 Tax=unclassified Vibrio TaxID=2614977 RepID=UPI0027C17F1E|nr:MULTISPECIES: ATP-binding protein [unclassified Vibrio]MDQ2108622.1 AAA family ATPase [Vibrio sp. 2017_1457_15]MDQ2161699.1 AAA family ATPase [Vibrio sp. 2017_1457_13]
MSKIIFISGIHGVGKGTLCRSLKELVGYPIYACSDLIKQNSSYIESCKIVSNAEKNQLALLAGLNKITEKVILLDGHFCLIGKNEQVIELDYETFDAIKPAKIVNVTCDEAIVNKRLKARDGEALSLKTLRSLQIAECNRAQDFASSRSIPLINFESGSDVNELITWITA